MHDPLLVTKVSLPILRHVLVPRKKALRQLTEGVQEGHLLTLVSAPAGYGKTTTIRMWFEAASYPVAGSPWKMPTMISNNFSPTF